MSGKKDGKSSWRASLCGGFFCFAYCTKKLTKIAKKLFIYLLTRKWENGTISISITISENINIEFNVVKQ